MTRPNFVLIGAMKCATSTVCRYFETHPDAFMLPGMEPNFFSHEEYWTKGLPWYEGLFSPGAEKRLIGEGSNLYTFADSYPDAAARMAQELPDAKLLYVVRHPIKRIISAFVQRRVDRGDDLPPDIEDALAADPDRLLDPSLYWRQIDRYRQYYPDSQIWVGFVEDLKADPDTFFASACAFLGVPPNKEENAAALHQNPSAEKRVPNARYTAVHQSPFFGIAKAVLPRSLKTWITGVALTDSGKDAGTLSAEAHQRLVDKIRPDAERFLTFAGKPTDFWSWDHDEGR